MAHFLMAEAQSEPVLIICQSRLAVQVEIEVNNFLCQFLFLLCLSLFCSVVHTVYFKHGILTRTRHHYLNLPGSQIRIIFIFVFCVCLWLYSSYGHTVCTSQRQAEPVLIIREIRLTLSFAAQACSSDENLSAHFLLHPAGGCVGCCSGLDSIFV